MKDSSKYKEQFDVVICGYGPVGATLAHLLGMCGVKVLILDREGSAYHLPRAVHFDDEVMRVFQTIGIANQIKQKTRVNVGMKFVDEDGKLLLDWPRPLKISDNGWHPSYRFHQPDLEKILRDEMPRRTSVTVRTSCEASAFEDDETAAYLKYEDLKTNEIHYVKSRYIVGCDGGRSLVREFINSGMEDYGFHERWLVVDVLLNKPKPELGDFSIQYCNPSRPATYVRGPENRRRWEITVLENESSQEISKESSVWNLLSEWLSPEEAILERSAVYTFNSKVAKKWKEGRLLLAGDAAHLTPPFMGQGMCAGIRDVYNLAWKLALVVQDKQDDTLLESYQTERAPNAKDYIQTAVRLGGLINTCGTEDALRKAFIQDDGTAKMKSILPPLGAGIGIGENAGKLFGQPLMYNEKWMDDVVGYNFVLIADAEFIKGMSMPEFLTIITTDDAKTVAIHLAKFGVKAVLLRPDRYILASANNNDELKILLKKSMPSPNL